MIFFCLGAESPGLVVFLTGGLIGPSPVVHPFLAGFDGACPDFFAIFTSWAASFSDIFAIVPSLPAGSILDAISGFEVISLAIAT